MTRQAYYKITKYRIQRVYQEDLVLNMISRVRKKARTNRWGGRKLYSILRAEFEAQNIQLGRDKFFDILRKNNLLVKKRKRKIYTTQSHHWLRKYDNLIENLVVTRINQVWVSDITYLKINGEVHYLYLITDVYSQKIVGWNLSMDLKAKSALRALKRAIAAQKHIAMGSLIHHSDRGVQYCSSDYTDLLKAKGILISMARPASPHENAIAERVNGILKEEWLKDIEDDACIEPEKYLKNIVKVYNEFRPHNSLGNLTPKAIHEKGFLRDKTERVIGKDYQWKKAAPKNGQPTISNNAIGPNDYSLSSCSSAALDSPSSWYCKIN
jgi:transposase InsO family protein